MLAIVVPTIVATLAFAWWFRASNTRARYRPGLGLFRPHRARRLVDPGADRDPARRRHLDRLAPARSRPMPVEGTGSPLEVQVVSLDWKWLFIYPDQRRRQRQRAGRPGRRAAALLADLGSVMNAFFVPQLGSMIYTMNGMVTQLNLQADNAGTYRACRRTSAATASPTCTSTSRVVSPAAVRRLGRGHGRAGAGARSRRPTPSSRSRATKSRPAYRPVEPDAVRGHRDPEAPAGAGAADAGAAAQSPPAELMMFGKLTWDAIPLDQPIPLIAAAVVALAILAVLVWVVVKGYLPYLWHEWITSVDHKRIGVMYVLLGAGDAAARLHRRDHDALAAGARVPRATATCRPSTTTRSSPRTARS